MFKCKPSESKILMDELKTQLGDCVYYQDAYSKVYQWVHTSKIDYLELRHLVLYIEGNIEDNRR